MVCEPGPSGASLAEWRIPGAGGRGERAGAFDKIASKMKVVESKLENVYQTNASFATIVKEPPARKEFLKVVCHTDSARNIVRAEVFAEAAVERQNHYKAAFFETSNAGGKVVKVTMFGILTWYKTYNYGSVLQAYSLVSKIKRLRLQRGSGPVLQRY